MNIVRRTCLTALSFSFVLALTRGQVLAEPGPVATAPIAYSTLLVISNDDSGSVIAGVGLILGV